MLSPPSQPKRRVEAVIKQTLGAERLQYVGNMILLWIEWLRSSVRWPSFCLVQEIPNAAPDPLVSGFNLVTGVFIERERAAMAMQGSAASVVGALPLDKSLSCAIGRIRIEQHCRCWHAELVCQPLHRAVKILFAPLHHQTDGPALAAPWSPWSATPKSKCPWGDANVFLEAAVEGFAFTR